MLANLRWASLAETTSRLASLVTVPLITHSLVPSQYGIFKSILLVISGLLILDGLANLDFLVQRHLPSRNDEGRANTITSSVLLFGGLIIVTGGLFTLVLHAKLLNYLSPSLQSVAAANYLVIIGLIASRPTYRFGLSIHRGIGHFRSYSLFTVFRELIFLSLIVGMFVYDAMTLKRVVYAVLFADLVTLVGTTYSVSGYLITNPDFGDFLARFRQTSLPLAPRVVLKKLKETVPDATLLAVFGASVFGQWVVIFTFATAFSFLSRPLSETLLPEISERLDEERPVDQLMSRYYRTLGVLVAPAIIGGWLVGPDAVSEVFGDRYRLSSIIIGLLVASFGLRTLNTLSGHFFIATDRSSYESINQSLLAFFRISFALVGAFVFHSLIVVALGFVLEQIASLAFALWYQSKWFDFSLPRPTTSGQIGVGLLILTFVVVGLRPFVNGLGSLLVVVIVGAISYFISLFVAGFFDKEEFAIIKRFIRVQD